MCMANYKTGSRLSTSADSNLAEQRSASKHLPASLNTRSVPSMELPPTLRIETADLARGDDSIPANADAQTLLSSVLEGLVAGMRSFFLSMGDLSKQPIVIVDLTCSDQSL